MGKDKMSKKSKLKLAAKKCRPIKSYFATKIPTTLDEAGHPTPNRNFACAEDDVVDAIADAASVFSVSADDYDEGARPPRQVDTSSLISMSDGGGSVVRSYSTFSVGQNTNANDKKITPDNAPNRNCGAKAKDPPKVFEVDDDLKPPAVSPTSPQLAKTIPLPLEWTQIGKSSADSFDIVEIEEVKWGMRICNCGCQEIADPTTSVLFHDEHGDNQAWLSEEFDTRTNYSIKLVPIRIPSNLKHVEMYREAAREMRSLPEYRNDYVFVEYLIHLMIQEASCDNMLQSIVIQVTLCSTARLGASMSEYGWTNKGNSEKSPSEEVGDALSNAFDWPDNATDYMNGRNFATIVARQSCRLVCMNKCSTACGGTYANGCKGMHCQPFTTREAIFKARVILIACKVWTK